MNLPIEKLEEDLSQICGRQADLYETALGISNHLAEKFLGGEDADPSLQQLNSLLNEIAGLNQLAGETRQRWEAQRRVPGRQLSSVLSRLEAAIRRLIDNIAQAEEYARQGASGWRRNWIARRSADRCGKPTRPHPARNPSDGDQRRTDFNPFGTEGIPLDNGRPMQPSTAHERRPSGTHPQLCPAAGDPAAGPTDETLELGRDAAEGILESVQELRGLLDLGPSPTGYEFVFRSAAMQQVVEQARRFARSSATVLLTGESGTGKELVARLIHAGSPRAEQRYECVNCAALPEPLMESELFGHQRGAFTDAVENRLGRFEWACGGTLLLDEISELPVKVQAKLLRVLEQEEFQRVGDNQTRHTNVRVLATTNRDLQEEVRQGGFRADLYYRLNVLEIRLPPLRQRPEDIPVLVEHFLALFGSEAAVAIRGVSTPAMRCLTEYSWPGNVRQLRNVIRRACILATSEWIRPEDLDRLPRDQEPLPPGWTHWTLDDIERQVIVQTLSRFRGNKTAVAKHLGITARTLTNKLQRYRQREAA